MIHHIYFSFIVALVMLVSCNPAETLPTSPNGIGEQIKEARTSLGISQEELATAIGLSENNIKTIEKGVAVPTRDIIVNIEETLGVEIILDEFYTHN